MKTVWWTCLVALALVSGHRLVSAGETARLRYVASIYADDKGTGLRLPEGVSCGANGQIVVGDTGNDRLVRYAYRDNTVSGGVAITSPQLSAPIRVQRNSKGEVYALDGKRRRIVRFSAAGEFAEALAFDGAPGADAAIVKSFAIDASDALYALDVFSGRVLVSNASGKFQRAIPIPDEVGFGTDLAVDAAGSVLLLDSVGRRLFSAVKGAAPFSPLGKPLTDASFTQPTSLAATRGLVVVAEGAGSRILTFGQDGTFLGRQLAMGWEEGALNYPSQMCVDDKDNVFIADRDNSRIQVFRLIR